MSGESLADQSEDSTGSWSESCQRVIDDSWLHCIILGDDDAIRDTPMQQLEAFLDDYSNRPVDRCIPGCLQFSKVVITRRMITLLRPLLVCDEMSSSSNGHNDNRDSSRGSNTTAKFSSARIENSCHFFSQADATTLDHQEDVCTPDDKRFFFTALARFTDELLIEDNDPEFLADLFNIPEINHLKTESLSIAQPGTLTEFEYLRLGAIIENSVSITDLALQLPFVNVPQAFCDSFSNAIHVQTLCLRIYFPRMTNEQKDACLATIMANEDGNGALEGLLRNPQNQLKELNLDVTSLEDYQVMVIAQLLPNSHVEIVDLCSNNIQLPGLLAFARQLPTMHSLSSISLRGNPWERSSLEAREECGAALLHALMENPFITWVDGFFDYFPQGPLLWHYRLLNDAGRRILTSSQKQPIPDGLWPRILSRAGRNSYEGSHDEAIQSMYNLRAAEALFFFLQSCPKIFSYL